jgi:hypothetical protein
MTARIECDEAHAPPLQRAIPSHAPPILVPVRRETMDEENRPPARTDIVIGDGHVAGLKLRHGFSQKWISLS